MRQKLIIFILFVLALVFIATSITTIQSFSTFEHCYDVEVPYTITEKYYSDEPYIDQECIVGKLQYYIEEPVHLEECMVRNWYRACTKEVHYCKLDVKNINGVAGDFTFRMTLKNMEDQSEIDLGEKTEYLPQTVDKVYVWSHTTRRVDDEFTCVISDLKIPEKKTCSPIIKYKTVEKIRKVIQYKTETVCE